MVRAGSAAAFGLMLMIASAGAQQIGASTTIDCRFSTKYTAVIKDGTFSAIGDRSSDLVTTFTGFSLEGRAQLIGNSGTVEVFYDVQGDVLLIAQLFGSAIRTLTTMPVPKGGQAVQAAHSRHTWFPGRSEAIISQWAGPCRFR
jgi:hypothetical protein